MKKNPDCTVLVCSCDKYADVVVPFAALWRKFWPDCPFETVLVTETPPRMLDFCFDRVIAPGTGFCWSELLVQALDQVATPYVMLLCNDYYLEAPVDTERLLRRLAQARTLDAVNLRLIPNPPKGLPQTDDLMEYPKNTAYCIATQAGFWNRVFLRNLAATTKSAWEFERYGSFAVGDETRPILATRTREFPFVDAVHKGYWESFGVDVCQKNGIALDFAVRGRPPWFVRFVEGVKKLIFALFPHTFIVRVQNALGAGARERR